MVDSVRFPPSIGGSGKTFTSDANPQTGVFNGGHRINFFPMLADTVAAAGYVSQYAQAIDGAKANADKAEEAAVFVESVADAYQVNLLAPVVKRATLGLDFVEGKYWENTGQRLESVDASDVIVTERNGPVLAMSSNGKLKEYGANVLAHEWKENLGFSALIQRGATNSYPHSALINHSVSGGGYSEIVPSLVHNGNALKLGGAVNNERAYLVMAETIPANVTQLTVSFYVEKPIEGIFASTLIWVSRKNDSSVSSAGNYDPQRGFPQLVSASFSAPEGFSLIRIGLGTTTSLIGSVVISLPQLEYGAVKASSRIITNGSAVSRPSDNIYRLLNGEIDTQRFSIAGSFYVSAATSPGWFDLFKLTNSQNLFGEGVGGQYRDNAFRVLVGNGVAGQGRQYVEMSLPFSDWVGTVATFLVTVNLERERVSITVNGQAAHFNVPGVNKQLGIDRLIFGEGALGIGGGIALESLVKHLGSIYLLPSS